MSDSLGFAIIGTGSIAEFHSRALGAVEGAHLVAVHSRGSERGRQFAAENGCEFIGDLATLLARPDIGAVAITTPSGTHAELGIAAAQAGKHVLCEKPLDITVDRIDALIAACERHRVELGAVFQSRMGPGAQAAKRAVEQGRFGRLTQCSAYIPWFRSEAYYAEVDWRGTQALDGGGALMNQGVHAVDLLLWLSGDVVEVSARCQTRVHRNIEVEDNAVAWLSYAHGGIGVIQASTCCFPGETKRIELKGETGSVTLADDCPVLWQFAEDNPEDAAVRALNESGEIGGGASDPRAISGQGHVAQYQDFVEAIAAGRAPAVTGRDARKAIELIEAIYRSSRESRVIRLAG